MSLSVCQVVPWGLTGEVSLSIEAGGDRIALWEAVPAPPPGKRVAASGMTFEMPEELPKALLVEGVKGSGGLRDVTLVARFQKAGVVIEDTVKLSVVSVNIVMEGVPEDQEEDPGAYIQVNEDDDDLDDVMDSVDTNGVVGPQGYDDELRTLTLEKPKTGQDGVDVVTLTWTEDPLHLYLSRDKTGQIFPTEPWNEFPVEQLPKDFYVEVAGIGDHLYVEAEFVKGGVSAQDKVNEKHIKVDLAAQGVHEMREENPGAFLAVGGPRKKVNALVAPDTIGPVKLYIVQPDTQVQVWTAETEGTLVQSGTEYATGAQVPPELWVQADHPSNAPRDISIRLELKDDPVHPGDTVNLTVFGIVTQTHSPTPPNRDRKLLGIGEQVNCSTTPSVLALWQTPGPGIVDPPQGVSTGFFAARLPDHDVTVSATVEGVSASVTFHVIAPTGVVYALKYDSPWGDPGGNITVGSRSIFSVTVQPTTVSFYGLTDHAREAIQYAEIVWPNGHTTYWNEEALPWDPISFANVVPDRLSCGRDPIGWLNGMGDLWSWLLTIHEQWEDSSQNPDWHVFASNVVHKHQYRKDDKASRVGAIPAGGGWAYGSWQGPYDLPPGQD